jgi:hypothetical protein
MTDQDTAANLSTLETPESPGEESKKKWSIWAKLGCGCGVIILLLIITCISGIFYLKSFVSGFTEPLIAKGYTEVSGQVIHVPADQVISNKTLYICQVLKFDGTATDDIAFCCQVIELKGTLDGDVDILAQVLKVHPGAVIKGNIRADALQFLENNGTIEGTITGTIQVQQSVTALTPSTTTDGGDDDGENHHEDGDGDNGDGDNDGS